MRIIYDSLYEFAKAVIRCNDTAIAENCACCPFYDDCQRDD